MLRDGDDEIGVMMGWERGIMKKTVDKLCEGHKNVGNLKILNVGFGLGIVRLLYMNCGNLLKISQDR